MYLQREPLTDITNKPKTVEDSVQAPPAIKRRINPTPINGAMDRFIREGLSLMSKEHLMFMKTVNFLNKVNDYAVKHNNVELLGMLKEFRVLYHAIRLYGQED